MSNLTDYFFGRSTLNNMDEDDFPKDSIRTVEENKPSFS